MGNLKAISNFTSCHWSFSIPPQNIKKPSAFLQLQGVQKETSGMNWIKEGIKTCHKKFNLFRPDVEACTVGVL